MAGVALSVAPPRCVSAASFLPLALYHSVVPIHLPVPLSNQFTICMSGSLLSCTRSKCFLTLWDTYVRGHLIDLVEFKHRLDRAWSDYCLFHAYACCDPGLWDAEPCEYLLARVANAWTVCLILTLDHLTIEDVICNSSTWHLISFPSHHMLQTYISYIHVIHVAITKTAVYSYLWSYPLLVAIIQIVTWCYSSTGTMLWTFHEICKNQRHLFFSGVKLSRSMSYYIPGTRIQQYTR